MVFLSDQWVITHSDKAHNIRPEVGVVEAMLTSRDLSLRTDRNEKFPYLIVHHGSLSRQNSAGALYTIPKKGKVSGNSLLMS